MLETAASVGWKVKDAIVWFHGIGRLGIAGTLWYMRRRRARKLRPQIALEALNQRYALGDIGRTEYLQNRDDILAAQRTASASSAGSRQ